MQPNLSFSPLQDGINVIICDLTLFRSKHMRGTVANDGQHLIFPQLVCTRVHKPSCYKTLKAVEVLYIDLQLPKANGNEHVFGK